MKTHGLGIGNVKKSLRKDVLTRVLLHMVKATLPVYLAQDNVWLTRQRSLKYMEHGVVLLAQQDVYYWADTQDTLIKGLTTRSWIKGGLIKHNGKVVIVRKLLDQMCFEMC
jgi:hypothetical protein